MYSKARLVFVVLLMAANSACVVASAAHRQFPVGVAGVLLLIPPLLREWDRLHGIIPRRLGTFEWSCLIGAGLFVAGLPFFT